MAFSILKKSESPWPNLTPLIDVTFLLIIFFILTGVYASATRSSLMPPLLADTQKLDEPARSGKFIINVVPYSDQQIQNEPDLAGQASYWVAAGKRLECGDYEGLLGLLAEKSAATDAIDIQLRCDKAILFTQVQGIIDALAAGGVTTVSYIAEPGGNSAEAAQ